MREELLFHLDYPSDPEPLYSNIRSVSGWSFHTSKSIDAPYSQNGFNPNVRSEPSSSGIRFGNTVHSSMFAICPRPVSTP